MNSKYWSKLLHFRIQMRFKLEQIQFKKMYCFQSYHHSVYYRPICCSYPSKRQTMSNLKILCLAPIANTLRLIYGEGLFSWDLSFGLTVESICSFLLGQIFGQLVGHSMSDWLLIFCSFYPPHMHFVRCF